MARNGADFRQLQQFHEKLERELQGTELEKFIKGAIKFLTAEFLRYVIPKTPVDDKSKNHVGGTLRRGWVANKEVGDGDNSNVINEFMNTVSVIKNGINYIIRVENPTEYASYVEYGHRTRNGGGMGYVEGQHFMADTEDEIGANAVEMLEDLLLEKINSALGGR